MTPLQLVRRRRKMSVNDLSSLTGIGVQSLYQYERGHPIPVNKAVVLANVLECTPCELLGLEQFCPTHQTGADRTMAQITDILLASPPSTRNIVLHLLQDLSGADNHITSGGTS